MHKILFGFLLYCLFPASAMAGEPLSLLAQLTNIPAASGYEKPVRSLLQSQWHPFMKELTTDGMGNLIGRYNGATKGPKLLLMAHMDETGFMVESVTKDGFVKVIPIGGIVNAVIYAQRWHIIGDEHPVIGYSGMDSPHILAEKRNETPEIKAMFLDIGATDKADAIKRFGMRPGLAVTPISEFTRLSDNRFLAKALDDRIGLAVISDVLTASQKQQPHYQLFAAATVQEEEGLRGASTVYQATHPDVTVNIEVGIADDYPSLKAERKNTIFLGKGPSLFVYDRSMIPNQALLQWVRNLAQKNNIAIQLEVEPGYGEDGAKLQMSGHGVPAINIGIPIRYAHQHAGVFDKRDYDNAVRLVNLIVENFNQDVANQIRKG